MLYKKSIIIVIIIIIRDEIVQTFGSIQTFYVGLVKKFRQYFVLQIKKSCSFVYFSSALDTVFKSSFESKPQGYQTVEMASFQHTFDFVSISILLVMTLISPLYNLPGSLPLQTISTPTLSLQS